MPQATKRRPAKKRAAKPRAKYRTVAELLARLGGISPDRVCMDPPPGTATKRDLIRLDGRGRRFYDLVDRTLVERPMGTPESHVGLEVGRRIANFLDDNDLGFACGADALIELFPNLVRGPDACFISWARRPERTVPRDPITDLIPDLAVEVLSPSNTRGEMAVKLDEYFRAGVRLVWIIDPAKETSEAYTAPDAKTAVEVLDGGDVLPGFRLPLAKLFERLAKPTPKKKRKK